MNFGEEPGKAAAMKLAGNLFLVAFTAGIGDMLAFAKALNISGEELSQLFDSWNPGTTLPARLKRMSGEDFSIASWRLDMARKDTNLILNEAAGKNAHLTVIPAIAALMDSWIKMGHGNDDWSIIGKAK